MYIPKLKLSNIHEVDVNELPDERLIGTLLLEETIKFPGDILVMNNKSYITVEKIHQYYFDGEKYQFAKTRLIVKSLETFC